MSSHAGNLISKFRLTSEMAARSRQSPLALAAFNPKRRSPLLPDAWETVPGGTGVIECEPARCPQVWPLARSSAMVFSRSRFRWQSRRRRLLSTPVGVRRFAIHQVRRTRQGPSRREMTLIAGGPARTCARFNPSSRTWGSRGTHQWRRYIDPCHGSAHRRLGSSSSTRFNEKRYFPF